MRAKVVFLGFAFNIILAQNCANMINSMPINEKSIQANKTNIDICYKKLQINNIKEYPLKSFKRAYAIYKLSKETLTQNEKLFLKSSIKDNISFFKNISKCSIINTKNTNYSLVYLGAENTQKGVLIVEDRIVNKELKRFYKYANNSFLYCQNQEYENNYIAYISNIVPEFSEAINSSLAIDSLKKDEKQAKEDMFKFPDLTNIETIKKKKAKAKKQKKAEIKKKKKANRFITIKKLYAKNYITEKKQYIPANSIVYYIGNNKEEIFFKYKKQKYRVIKEHWQKKTKRSQ